MGHIFSCEPDCPRRRPGCQDHCEQHQQQRAENERRKALARKECELRDYTIRVASIRADARAKNKRANHGIKSFHKG